MNTAIKLPPKELTINATSLSALAKEYNLQLKGPDREINMMGYLDDESEFLDGMLSYALGIEYVEDVKNRGIAAVIVPESLASEIPAGFSALLTRDNPDDKFHSIFVDFIAKDKWQKVDKYIGERVKIAPSVVIMDPVYIGDDCEIDPNTVLYPNTVLEKQVHIGANSNISPIGFEIKHFGGKRRLIPHNGGVWIEENVEIGCSVTVDSNMFGKFTRIGKDTKVANQVQIAHGAQIGRSCMIQGSSQIANCHMGDYVVTGANTTVFTHTNMGDYSFLGGGSVLTRDLPDYALAYGNPAKIKGWICECRNWRKKLEFINDKAVCKECGRKYVKIGKSVKRVG